MSERLKAIALALTALLIACSPNITKSDIDLAIKLCEPNGGLDRMTNTLMQSGRSQITAYCNNGVVATKLMEAK